VHLLLDYKSLVRLSLSKKVSRIFHRSIVPLLQWHVSQAQDDMKLNVTVKNFVGSAQRRYAAAHGEEVVLQHGSILIGVEHKQMVDYLNLPSEEQRVALKRELDEKTTELSTVLNRTVKFDETADAILHGFRKAWSISPEVVNIFDKEQKVIK